MMPKFEYLCVPRWTAERDPDGGAFTRTDANALGAEGWELVAVVDSEMHFMRMVG